ncbi:flagellar motor switch protein FliN [Plasticicumulans acidivorans]|uniref:Flagellar motor switch protein FliN n=1 Tax=Plasticicumulans acidivorans TaxID=886464 RepID=A0A317MXM7_9GAMM|nr:flagellar motor switch protein FliN [Plasticicumulans acidivorans]PWV63274.1 flagellar motor switch protein FliN/FliY [Plasticicumulans acidivorans]
MSDNEDKPQADAEAAVDAPPPEAVAEAAAAEAPPPVEPQAEAPGPASTAAFEREFTEPKPRDSGAPRRDANLDMILDIPVTLSMELGRTRLSVRELLQLTQGSVVRLDRPAGEPLDILVNGCLIARGEVVVVNERFGVRITEISSPEERVKRLR